MNDQEIMHMSQQDTMFNRARQVFVSEVAIMKRTYGRTTAEKRLKEFQAVKRIAAALNVELRL